VPIEIGLVEFPHAAAVFSVASGFGASALSVASGFSASALSVARGLGASVFPAATILARPMLFAGSLSLARLRR
jgi:hypothetical protein